MIANCGSAPQAPSLSERLRQLPAHHTSLHALPHSHSFHIPFLPEQLSCHTACGAQGRYYGVRWLPWGGRDGKQRAASKVGKQLGARFRS